MRWRNCETLSPTMLFVVGSQLCTGRNVSQSSCCTIRIRNLFDAELGHYLDVTADDIKNAVSQVC